MAYQVSVYINNARFPGKDLYKETAIAQNCQSLIFWGDLEGKRWFEYNTLSHENCPPTQQQLSSQGFGP